jgi:hypothetical protein
VSAFKIVEGGPPITFARATDAAADPFASPLFLRGSMNGWGTSLPLAKDSDGIFAVEMPLEAGDYQFKVGSADWQTADFGGVGTAPISGAVVALPLISHGGNIQLTIANPGTYRFELKRVGANALLTLRRLEAKSTN